MKHIFFATLVIILSLLTPAYLPFAVAIIYLLITGISPVYLIILGVLLDSIYGHRFSLIEISLPMYTSLSVIAFFAIATITKRLSFIN